jgi:hypothetical protein
MKFCQILVCSVLNLALVSTGLAEEQIVAAEEQIVAAEELNACVEKRKARALKEVKNLPGTQVDLNVFTLSEYAGHTNGFRINYNHGYGKWQGREAGYYSSKYIVAKAINPQNKDSIRYYVGIKFKIAAQTGVEAGVGQSEEDLDCEIVGMVEVLENRH